MSAIEDKGQKLGLTKLIMMENAGNSVANYIHNSLPKQIGNHLVKIVAIAGTGNNGGDVLVAARHLAYWPAYAISVVLIGSENDIHAEEAKINWKILSQIPKIKKLIIDNEKKLGLLDKEISDARALIIGIFGTGFKGTPRDLQLGSIMRINRVKKPLKISVDIPSGMEADSGISYHSIKSDVTVTMHAPKIGMLKPAARKKTGKIIEANIGLPF
jgi:hydroxyethylthiazole kinase-like uncharacterized protein yjeF